MQYSAEQMAQKGFTLIELMIVVPSALLETHVRYKQKRQPTIGL